MAKTISPLWFVWLLCPLIALAETGHEKIVYHVHGSDPETLYRSITNLENLIEGMSDQQLDIRLLLQGESIQLFNPYMYQPEVHARLRQLQGKGVKVEVKQENYLKQRQFLHDQFDPIVVDNIFSRIIDLQQQGYHYITP
ncbi:MAG: DsrE family protein [Gammaproteobacteria bacterium]|nr:DsrE family protein [Gammaproteobacteria bacterium]